ncbi:MAG TPA: hypothetical protein VJC05_02465 [Candidatus Andersenbacteria bacterium]|nr:hypothetical protein [Candidatus Andersenbacteria bacterium]
MRTLGLLLIIPLLGATIAAFALWEDKSGNLVTSLNTGWGDQLVHVRAAIFFAEQGGWPRESFFLAGEPVGYAFLADLVSAWLWRSGLSLAQAFAWPTMILAGGLLLGTEILTYYFTRSRAAAILSATLFLTFGGLSGWPALAEIAAADVSSLQALRDLPHGLTAWGERGYVILNPFVTMLHQRSFLVGWPVFLLLLYSTAKLLQRPAAHRALLVIALALLLTLAHPFTALAFLFILPSWVAWTLILRIRRYSLPTLGLLLGTFALSAAGSFLILKTLQPAASSSLITWQPGWLAPGASWPLLWLKNIGLYVLLAPLALLSLVRRNRPLAALMLATLTPFIAANLFKFAPWDWDNNKLFFSTWLGLTMATAAAGADVLRHQQRWLPATSLVAGLLLLTLTLSGGLENLRVLAYRSAPTGISTPAHHHLGETVRSLTDPRAILLTAPAAHNPVFLFSGRPSLVAYEGWLWSNGWGGRFEERILDTKAIYAGAPTAAALLQKYSIQYVAIGPPEMALGANREWFNQNYTSILQEADTTVYATK